VIHLALTKAAKLHRRSESKISIQLLSKLEHDVYSNVGGRGDLRFFPKVLHRSTESTSRSLYLSVYHQTFLLLVNFELPFFTLSHLKLYPALCLGTAGSFLSYILTTELIHSSQGFQKWEKWLLRMVLFITDLPYWSWLSVISIHHYEIIPWNIKGLGKRRESIRSEDRHIPY
jgi:hypothetical protein